MQFKSTFLLGLIFAVAAVNAAPAEHEVPENCTAIGANRFCCWVGGSLGCSQMKKRDLHAVASAETTEKNVKPENCTPIGANRWCCWVGGNLGCSQM
ncbi:hypothetical protein EDD21DRAFT_377627 [Dissophora ornata]|nr:hypothetical protein EDD21DRAFT_377627 [Dissophora ornata]